MMSDTGGKQKWYFKTSVLVIAFLCVGPLMLPLIWFNPHLDKTKKIIATIIIAVLTYFMWVLLASSLERMLYK